MSTIADRLIEDEGLKRGLARLTPEKIEKTFKALIAGECGARLKTYLETCVHCGMCAKACHYYMSHKDPSYAPVAKVSQTMVKLMAAGGRVEPSSSRNAPRSPTPSATCVGAAFIMSARHRHRLHHERGAPAVPQARGHAPVHPGHSHSHSATMNQMWVKDDEWPDTLQWQEEEARDEFPGLRIPSMSRAWTSCTQSSPRNPSSGPSSSTRPRPSSTPPACPGPCRLRPAGTTPTWPCSPATPRSAPGWSAPTMRRPAPARQAHRHGRVRPRLPGRLRRGQPLARLEMASGAGRAFH